MGRCKGSHRNNDGRKHRLHNIKSLYTCHTNRRRSCQETKEIILDERFRERDLAARDHHFEDPSEAIKYVFDHPLFHYPGGESNIEVQARGIEALREIISAHKGKKIAIGVHGLIMTCTMNYFSDQYGLNFWKGTSKPDIYQLQLDENFLLLHCKRLWAQKKEFDLLKIL